MKNFDLIIIGGGAGAFAAAIRANELEANTAIINAGLPLGGTCVNVGCVPSKTLLWAAETIHHAKHHQIPGVELEVKNFDFQKVVQDELALVEKLRQEKYEKVLQNLKYVTAIEGKATFDSANQVAVNDEKLTAEKFIIATGSTATVPPIDGIRDVGFITHIEALRLEKLPQSLVVIGAGPVGLEFAQMFARFGTKVTILQRGGSIFPPAENQLTHRLTEILTNEGIDIKTNAEVTSARIENGQKIVSFLVGDAEEKVAAEEILLAAGKTPNTHGLGLDLAGVEINDRQAVVVSENFLTSNQSMAAVGDVTNAPLRLETTAGREGTLAAENILKGTTLAIDYHTVPYTIFTDPQLAGVGLTEDDQMKEMGVCACRTVSLKDVPKAIIMRRTEGLVKMAIYPDSHQIQGVHILAPNAGELIAEAMMLVKNKNTIEDVINSLPMFPTLAEAIKLAALSYTKDISKLSCCI
ncbi:MAG: mercury(II) reductase [Candidatus Pacebacteria bacterium CG10_big_fil_rev_8_21_14_0_10_56_10]|nr:MAG: mercury(II) reductase [Candidatus Pacebacteria bacterium CG10_big_fil_rev_8_21_14_0_10_56_10]